MIPVTMLLVNVDLIVSRDENLDWISPKWRFSKKDKGSLNRWSNILVFHCMLVNVFSVKDVQALNMLMKALKSVNDTSPIQITASKLSSCAIITWSVTSWVPTGNNKPMASITTEKAKILSSVLLSPTMLLIKSIMRRRDLTVSCWKFCSGHSSSAMPVKLLDISWSPITRLPSAGSCTMKLDLRTLVRTT